ncbi:MAG: hypothetical protein ABIC91_03485 [Nanoarchaeota archaeon]|nr:hypothetical protein [Nanoarchaeota archaeon]MBU1849178.1 hypothetical protein [Nanoarchaeota archaeon]
MKIRNGLNSFIIMLIFLISLISVHANVESYQFQDYSQLVNIDLYTGDMGLSIPLFTVPGRGGMSYPVVLNYQAGISTTQTASWVGLGWSLGTGAVTRNVNGVPDEYNRNNVKIYFKQEKPGFIDSAATWLSHLVSALGQNFYHSSDIYMMSYVYRSIIGEFIESTLDGLLFSGNIGVKSDFSGMQLEIGKTNQVKIDGWFNIVDPDDVKKYYSSTSTAVYCVEPTNYRPFNEMSCSLAGGTVCDTHETIECDEDSDCPVVRWSNGLEILEEEGICSYHVCKVKMNNGKELESKNIYYCRLEEYFGNAKSWDVDEESPDTFYVSLPSTSGLLVVSKSWNKYAGKNNFRYKLQQTSTLFQNDIEPLFNGDLLEGFLFKGLDGTKYYFTKKELIQSSKTQRALTTSSSCSSGDGRMSFELNTPHPYTWKLEMIESVNYKDSDNIVGPSIGDEGNWIKFEYETLSDSFTLNQPYKFVCKSDANGLSSRSTQEMSISYLKSIETPTHKAVFVTSPRLDAQEEENSALHQKKLDEVILYAKTKNDGLEKVTDYKFNYDYSLMQGISGSSSGQLTLKSLTQYDSMGKENLPPYNFKYDSSNPKWTDRYYDRWGYYIENYGYRESGLPDGLLPDAWSMTSIKWPNGGITEFVYEPDRYTKIGSLDADYTTMSNKEVESKDTHYGGGLRVSLIRNCNGIDECVSQKFLYNKIFFDTDENDGINQKNIYGESSGVATVEPAHGLSNILDDRIYKGSIYASPKVTYGQVTVIPFYDEEEKVGYGYQVYKFTTAETNPNTGKTYGNLTRCHLNSDGEIDSDSDYGVCQKIADTKCNQIFFAPTGVKLELWSIGTFVKDICKGNSGGYCISNLEYNNAGKAISDGLYSVWSNKGGTRKARFQILIQEESQGCGVVVGQDWDRDNNEIPDVLEISNKEYHAAEQSQEHKRGLVSMVSVYDNDKTLIQKSVNEYSKKTVISNKGYVSSGLNQVTKSESTQDGMTSSVEYEYQSDGFLRKTFATNTDGKTLISTTKYAYENYPEMKEKNMFSQIYETKTFENTETNANILSFSRNIWKSFDDDWYPFQSQIWVNDKTQASTEYAKSKSVVPTPNRVVSTIVSYDKYGNVLESKDALGNSAYFFYGDNTNPCSNNENVNGFQHSVLTCAKNVLGHESKTYLNNKYLTEKVIGSNGEQAEYEFDSFNRLIKSAGPGSDLKNPDVTYEYHFFENERNPNWIKTITKIDDKQTAVLIAFVDGLGRTMQTQVQEDNQNWLVSKTEYYPRTNLVSKTWKTIRKVTRGLFDSTEGEGIYSKVIYEENPLLRVKEMVPALVEE